MSLRTLFVMFVSLRDVKKKDRRKSMFKLQLLAFLDLSSYKKGRNKNMDQSNMA